MLSDTADLVVLRVPGPLGPPDLERAARPIAVVADDETRRRIEVCHRFVLDSHAASQAIYGVTTGFGPLVGFPGRSGLADQAENTLNHLTASATARTCRPPSYAQHCWSGSGRWPGALRCFVIGHRRPHGDAAYRLRPGRAPPGVRWC
ncbi:aromatic amino acid lyase [Saccharopolyspora spinosa]|uniref:aromatic amino acid lyase n=1 Tax=Saccharopolyspora spinosa TaxID=60894 RepID=UPI00376EC472